MLAAGAREEAVAYGLAAKAHALLFIARAGPLGGEGPGLSCWWPIT